MEVMPETSRGDVSQRIREIMGHHLRLTGRTRGEIHQGNVVVGIHMSRTHERRCRLHSFVEVFKTFWIFRSHAHQPFHRRRFRHGVQNMFRDDRFTGSHNCLDARRLATVHNVFLGQQMRGRNGDGPDFVQGNDGNQNSYRRFRISITLSPCLIPRL